MRQHFEDGEKILGRFVIEECLGEGVLGDTYLANDLEKKKRCVLKVASKPIDPLTGQYLAHLKQLRRELSDLSERGVVVPVLVEETDDFIYQVLPYIGPGTRSLTDLLDKEGAVGPRRALEILRDVSSALNCIHSRGVIHADIKPGNILVGADGRARITDFGLAQRAQEQDRILWVGTYRYAHPAIRDYLPKRPGSTTARIQPTVQGVGAYVDIYSLGVTAMEMLTGDTSVSYPSSAEEIRSRLNWRDPAYMSLSVAFVNDLCDLVFSMLSACPDREGVSARGVSVAASALVEQVTGAWSSKALRRKADDTETLYQVSELRDPLQSLEKVVDKFELFTRSLMYETSVMVRSVRELRERSLAESALDEIGKAVETARRRIRTSWSIGVFMTLSCFALVFTMVGIAVTVSIVQGMNLWVVVFGGAGVSTVIGTLLWHPYDRVFRATILAQQLEIIHIQTLSVFKSTQDVNRRIEACQEALISLKALLETHA